MSSANIADRLAVSDALIRYATALDGRDWDLLASCFTADARLDYDTSGVFGRDVRLTREKLGLSQKAFAARFSINLRRLQDWEQGRVSPDSVTLAYLKLIQREPELVRRIVAAS